MPYASQLSVLKRDYHSVLDSLRRSGIPKVSNPFVEELEEGVMEDLNFIRLLILCICKESGVAVPASCRGV